MPTTRINTIRIPHNVLIMQLNAPSSSRICLELKLHLLGIAKCITVAANCLIHGGRTTPQHL